MFIELLEERLPPSALRGTPQPKAAAEGAYVTAIWGYRERLGNVYATHDQIVIYRAWSNGAFEVITPSVVGRNQWRPVADGLAGLPQRPE